MLESALTQVEDRLFEMSNRVATAITKAVQSLANEDIQLARQVIDEDRAINRLEMEIDDEVTRLLATQQPVAKDLRRLIAAMKIASDLERMGDLAENIADVTIEMQTAHLRLFKKLEDTSKMAAITEKMVSRATQSFLQGDVELAKSIAEMDDQVDRYYDSLTQELINYIPYHTENTEVAIKLCLVARYLERIADHTTNLSENIIYIETGEMENLN